MPTLNIEGQRVKVDDAFLSMSPDEQSAAVEEIAASLGVKPQSSGPVSQLNRGAADFVSGVANIANAPVNAAIGGVNRLAGTEIPKLNADAAGMLREAGLPVAEGDPSTVADALLRGTGEAGAALIPTVKALQLASKGSGAVAKWSQDVLSQFIRSPKGAAAVELAAGAGGRGAGEAAEQAGAPPAVQLAAEMAGGIGTGVGLAGAGRAVTVADDVLSSMPGPFGAAYRAVVKQTVPFSGAGARARAGDRVQSLSADPQGQAAALSHDSSLTPAQQTGDPRLMRLERSIMAQDPAAEDAFRAANEGREAALAESMGAGQGGAPAARDAMADRREQFGKIMETVVRQAQTDAEDAAVATGPRRAASANSSDVRTNLDGALSQAKMVESDLWGAVPMDAQVPTGASRAALAQIDAETGVAGKGNIPRVARETLEQLDENTTVREMHELYSEMRQVAREASSGVAPNMKRARMANVIADAALEDLGATTHPATDVGQAVNEARAWTRQLHETFDRGEVGKILQQTRAGGERVDADVTLSALDRGGAGGKVTIRDIRQAVGNRSDEAMSDYVRGMFQRAAAPSGEFNVRSGRRFLNLNREVMEQFPELEIELRTAVRKAERAGTLAESTGRRVKSVNDPKKSAGAAFVNARFGRELNDAVFATRDPVASAKALRREAARDPSGAALGGLKGAAADFLIGQNRPIVPMLDDPRIGGAVRELMDAAEFERLRKVGIEMDRLRTSMNDPTTFESIIDDPANTILTYVARIAAARHGAAVGGGGGGSIQTAQMASERVKRILGTLTTDGAENVIRQALDDPDLFSALLTRQSVTSRKAENRLINAIAGYAATQISEDEK